MSQSAKMLENHTAEVAAQVAASRLKKAGVKVAPIVKDASRATSAAGPKVSRRLVKRWAGV